MSLMDTREVVECIKAKLDRTFLGPLSWPPFILGYRYIMPQELANDLVKEGYVKIIQPEVADTIQ